jgi:hypothetical protein
VIADSVVIAKFAKRIQTSIQDRIGDRVRDTIETRIRSRARHRVEARVHDRALEQTQYRVWEPVWEQVRNQVWGQVQSKINIVTMLADSVDMASLDGTSERIYSCLWNQVRNETQDTIYFTRARVQQTVSDCINASVSGQVQDQILGQVWVKRGGLLTVQPWANVLYRVRNTMWDHLRTGIMRRTRLEVGGRIR